MRVPSLAEVRQLFTRSFDAAPATVRRGATIRQMGRLNSEIAAAAERVARGASWHRHNNPWIANGVENLKTGLVGSGSRPTPRGVSRQVRRAIIRRFDKWAASADYSGRADFWGLQLLMAETLIVHGEFLAILHDGPDGLEIQPVSPDQLDRTKTAELANGNVITQGVERDPRGRPVAYWITPENPTSELTHYAPSVRIEAEDVIHVFRILSAGQVRGISWLAPAILTASELDALTDALLMSAKIAAMHAGFVTDQTNMGGASVAFPDADGINDLSLEPGVIRILPGGTDIHFNSPEQIKDAPGFLRTYLQSLAASLGIPEHALSGDLSQANYSSLKQANITFRQRIEALQYSILVPMFLRPIWQRWLALEVLSGRLDVPLDTEAEWIMPRATWLDPVKDVAAIREALALGLMSRTQAVAELGWDVESLDEEIAADREREAELGLNFSQQGGTDGRGL